MRRPLESAVIRRDSRLDRMRRLSMWVAGGATAASLGLAGVLGVVIPGKAANTGSQSQAGRAAGPQAAPQAGQPATAKSSGHRGSSHPRRLAAPSSAPSSSSAPPVVSSGGS